MSELTDEQIDEMIESPDKIETVEHAREIIDILGQEIADIRAQIDVAEVEAAGQGGLSEPRYAWLQRAAYAKAMRIKSLDKVHKRERELRGLFAQVRLSRAEKKEANLLKQQRLMVEAQNRRESKKSLAEAKRAEQTAFAQMIKSKREASARFSFQNVFQVVAKERLGEEKYREIMAETKRRVPSRQENCAEPLAIESVPAPSQDIGR